jgi:transcriptional regulator
VPNPYAKTNPATVADEQDKVLDLKRQGLSVRAIADQLGMTKSTVQNRLDAAIAEIVHPAAEAVRTVELERLDAWHVKLEGQLDAGEDPTKVVPVLLRCQERRAKYLGLDAPERAEVTVTGTAPDEETAALLAAARERSATRVAQVRGES